MPSNLNISVKSMTNVLDLTVPPNSLGQELFDEVLRHLRIREKWFFGLNYVDSKNVSSWLQMDVKLSKVDFREGSGRKINILFRVRLFPEDASSELIESITQELFFLQVQESILNEEIFAPAETAIFLASLALQAKHGPFQESKLALIRNEKLLSRTVVAQYNFSAAEWEQKIVKLWQEYPTMMQEDARLEYLKISQDLEMYGIRYFEVQNKKKTELLLGVDALGINIYDKNNKITPKIGFAWSEIGNIHADGKKLLIKSREKAADIVFFVERRRINRQIVSLCRANHNLYTIRRQPEMPEIQELKRQAQIQKAQRRREHEKREKEEELRESENRRLESQRMASVSRTIDEIHQETSPVDKPPRSFAAHAIDDESKTIKNQNERIRNEIQESPRQSQPSIIEEPEFDDGRRSPASVSDGNETLASFRALDQTVETTEKRNHQIERDVNAADQLRNDLKKTNSQARTILASREKKYDDDQSVTYEDPLYPNEHEEQNNVKENPRESEKFIERAVKPAEERRKPLVQRNPTIESKSRDIRKDLEKHQRADIVSDDRIYRENTVDKGIDKYKTLKKIREGTVKRRIDEFEAM